MNHTTNSAIKNIVFDLDGTLIDSAPAILASFADAFRSCGQTPARPLTNDVIGPPLMETLALLAGSNDSAVLQALAEGFKASYDTTGYRQTAVFDGVDTMLRNLVTGNIPLYIATNKRLLPTQRILSHLGWDDLFAGVYALDAYTPAVKTKREMIGRVLVDHDLARAETIYIGDRDEDGQSATANDLRFWLATWGYDGECEAQWQRLRAPDDIVSLVLEKNAQ